MDEAIAALLALLKNGWTPGGVGIWVLVAMVGLGLWKGMPTVLDAWTRRADAEAARTDREFARLEAQIKSSEERHQSCEERCTRLQSEVERLNKILDGLMRQMRQMQISAVRVGATEPPTVTAHLIAELDRIPGGDLK